VDPRVEDTIAFIERHLDTAISVPALASLVGLSVSQLTRLFRRETGTTPTVYMHRRRMECARTLIERTSLSVSEVMARVGIADPSHFARDFRQTHGFSPRTLRRHLRITCHASPSIPWKPTR
jgi:AraC family transcriptional regulator of arabinose operon